MCVFDVFNCKNCVCRLYILHVVQTADITLQGFLSAAQFLTVNSGGRFFNRTPSVLLSSTSERPSTAKTTQHPDPSIDPQVDPSHPSPHPSFPLCSSDLMSRSKYWSASGPSLLRSPSPPSPHGFNYDISKTSLLYRLSLICFWHLRTLSKNRTNESARVHSRTPIHIPREEERCITMLLEKSDKPCTEWIFRYVL